MPTQLRERYRCADGPIFLTVVIGNRQIGGSAVFIDDDPVPLHLGNVNHAFIGNGRELDGHRVFVKTIVSDRNDQTNRTVVTYLFEGGPEQGVFSQAEEVTNDGDSIIYRAWFDLTREEK